jgi:hypothetical protein
MRKKATSEAVRDRRSRATKVFCFTLKDIADAVGRSLPTIWRATASGKLNPRDIISIAEYIMAHRNKERKKMAAPKATETPETARSREAVATQ